MASSQSQSRYLAKASKTKYEGLLKETLLRNTLLLTKKLNNDKTMKTCTSQSDWERKMNAEYILKSTLSKSKSLEGPRQVAGKSCLGERWKPKDNTRNKKLGRVVNYNKKRPPPLQESRKGSDKKTQTCDDLLFRRHSGMSRKEAEYFPKKKLDSEISQDKKCSPTLPALKKDTEKKVLTVPIRRHYRVSWEDYPPVDPDYSEYNGSSCPSKLPAYEVKKRSLERRYDLLNLNDEVDGYTMGQYVDDRDVFSSKLPSLNEYLKNNQYNTNRDVSQGVEESPGELLIGKGSGQSHRKWPMKYRRDEDCRLRSKGMSNNAESIDGKHDVNVSNVETSENKNLPKESKRPPDRQLTQQTEDKKEKETRRIPSIDRISEDCEGKEQETNTDVAKEEEVWPFKESDSDSDSVSSFDFECLTKPRMSNLSTNQKEYKRVCKRMKLVPSAYILRGLATNDITLTSFQLGRRRIKALCCALALNETVTSLEISKDDIDLYAMSYVTFMCEENEYITRLNLSNNKLGRVKVKMLLDILNDTDRLRYLNLSGNEIEDCDGDIFVNYLQGTKYLTSLDLSYNNLREEAPGILAKALAFNTSLVKLDLCWNHIGAIGAQRFFSEIENNKRLTHLALGWNGLGSEGVTALCKSLKINTTITVVDIRANRINFDSMKELFVSLQNAKSLVKLMIDKNLLTTEMTYCLLYDLLTCKGQLHLKNLDLGDTVVNVKCVEIVEMLRKRRDILVRHGYVLDALENPTNDLKLLATLDPVVVLIEYAKLIGMTFLELFDYDNLETGTTFSREEIREVLLKYEIPLPEESLSILIRKLDIDGDGEISVSELLSVVSKGRYSKEAVEGVRCRKLLKRLIMRNDAKSYSEINRSFDDQKDVQSGSLRSKTSFMSEESSLSDTFTLDSLR